MSHTCNPEIYDNEMGGFQVQDQTGLCREIPSQKTNRKK